MTCPHVRAPGLRTPPNYEARSTGQTPGTPSVRTSRLPHTTCLTPRDRVYVNLDVAQHGVGSGACGPRVQPRYVRHAQPVSLTLGFRTC
ncbi:hypothetical protein ACFYZI_38090 [Streptomyces griseorubiginosus]|uniref:hypothetical protein n=1 Tax=Streptomyces griseorubiginosus TaxID=67304 RepID=UPI0033344F13